MKSDRHSVQLFCCLAGLTILTSCSAHNAQPAYQECLPMFERVRQNNGFFEWYTVDNKPSGSGMFRGSAGVLGKALQMFHEWAKEQPNENEAS